MSLVLLPAPRELERGPGSAGPAPDATPSVRHEPELPAEGFALRVDEHGIEIAHADDAGLRYARETLRQIESQSPGGLPALRIRDWPDFPVRGYMLDVSRDRVPSLDTLARLADVLVLLRINHLQLYTEHTFAYRDHETVWREASPITPEDVRWLDALCAERGIELTANQNTFGHMARWLRHAAYRSRAEAPDGFRTKLGMSLPASVLAPSEDNARFAIELCRELLACHSSRRINIGCDETWELGQGQSRERVEQVGRGRVYLDHVLRIMRGLQGDGHEVLFWGDILRNHPELVGELPERDTIALAWHYEAPVEKLELPPAVLEIAAEFGMTPESMRGFEGHVGAFASGGVPFWVCPGTSSWNTFVGRLPNAKANLLDAVQVGRARGAGGVLITDWGDNGHLQPLSVSLPPLAYGAAVAWCEETNRELDLAEALDRFVFEDAAGELGAALEQMGGVYSATGRIGINASPLFTALVSGGALGSLGQATAPGCRAAAELLDDAVARVERSRPACPDAGAVKRELTAACQLARHGAWRIAREADLPRPTDDQLREDLTASIQAQRDSWHERSRPGGLEDSLARLERPLAEYR